MGETIVILRVLKLNIHVSTHTKKNLKFKHFTFKSVENRTQNMHKKYKIFF